MKGLLPESWEKMHHAYWIVKGEDENLWSFLETDLGFRKQTNPDAYTREVDNFGVDEARELSVWAIKKSFGERKVAVISALSITTEAQNALLKLFEEPAPNTFFFLNIQSLGVGLPTLLSRMHVVGASGEGENNKKEKLGKEFLEGDVNKRLKMISPILKEKDKERAKDLLFYISKTLEHIQIEEKEKNKDSLVLILNAERYLSGRAPSLKMILELVAITLPIAKSL